jgi:hypothetical protein
MYTLILMYLDFINEIVYWLTGEFIPQQGI